MPIEDRIAGALLALAPWMAAIFWVTLILILAHLLVLKYLARSHPWLRRTEFLLGATVFLCFASGQVALFQWI